MNAVCPSCGKSLKVKDEYAGKRLKCPGCGETFMASATSAAAPRLANPTAKSAPAAKGAKPPVPTRTPARAEGPRFAINGNVILLAAGAAAVLILIAMVILGPVRVHRHWSAHQEAAENDVRDVVELAMKAYASHKGTWNPRKPTGGSPSVGDLRMLPDIFTLSVPETVHFDGFGTVGEFAGTYRFATGEIDLNLEPGGLMLPSGVFQGKNGVSIAGGQRGNTSVQSPIKGAEGGATLHVTGRVANGQPSAEIDGKKATIYYPPEVDEDGNLIEPPKPM